MQNFIMNSLVNTRNKNLKAFAYQHTCDNGDNISVNGAVKYGNAEFTISRTTAAGHRCSNIPVYQMPLTDKYIHYIAEFAAENL